MVLILHVASAVVALAAIAVGGIFAASLHDAIRRNRPLGSEPRRRYYEPGINWVGRSIYGVPLFGFILLAESNGRYGLGRGWVLGGLATWLIAAGVAEWLLWPAEQRIRSTLARAAEGLPTGEGVPIAEVHVGELSRLSRRVGVVSVAIVTLLVVGSILMVVKP